jgi:hypothetical protein
VTAGPNVAARVFLSQIHLSGSKIRGDFRFRIMVFKGMCILHGTARKI